MIRSTRNPITPTTRKFTNTDTPSKAANMVFDFLFFLRESSKDSWLVALLLLLPTLSRATLVILLSFTPLVSGNFFSNKFYCFVHKWQLHRSNRSYNKICKHLQYKFVLHNLVVANLYPEVVRSYYCAFLPVCFL